MTRAVPPRPRATSLGGARHPGRRDLDPRHRRRSARPTERRDRGAGFWASLADLFMPDEDRHTYAEGLSAAAIC